MLFYNFLVYNKSCQSMLSFYYILLNPMKLQLKSGPLKNNNDLGSSSKNSPNLHNWQKSKHIQIYYDLNNLTKKTTFHWGVCVLCKLSNRKWKQTQMSKHAWLEQSSAQALIIHIGSPQSQHYNKIFITLTSVLLKLHGGEVSSYLLYMRWQVERKMTKMTKQLNWYSKWK